MKGKSQPTAAAGLPGTAGRAALMAGPGDQACCCVARAVVRVIMPSASGRPHETELLLCGHHYRISRAALSAARARVEELSGSPGPTDWFDGDRGRSARATIGAG